MDESSRREGKLDDHTNSVRKHNIHPTAEIYSETNSNRNSPECKRPLRQINAHNNIQSPLQNIPGTVKPISIPSTDPYTRQLQGIIHSPNQHFITKTEENFNDNAVDTVINTLPSNHDNSTIRERIQKLHSVQDNNNPRSLGNNTNINQDKYSPENQLNESTVEIHNNRDSDTYSYRSGSSGTASAYEPNTDSETENEPPRHQAKRRKIQTPTEYMGERTPTNIRRRLFHPEPRFTNRSPDTSGNIKYFTFTLSKSNVARLPTNSNQCPTFIRFDHGDHWHILYTATTDSNAYRQLRRICKHLHATPAGFAESSAGKQTVRHIWRFVEYCSRYGIGTVHKFGYKIDDKITNVINKLNTMNIPENTDNTEPCRQYAEEQKEKFQKQRQFKNITHTVTEIIAKNNIESQTDWDLKIDLQTKMQLMAEFGLRVGNYVQTILRINRAETTKQIKLKTFLSVYLDILEKHPFTEDDIVGTNWLMHLFEKNKINLIEFFAWHEIIKTHRYTKINTIIYHGPTNAGKSMLLDLIIKPLHPEEIPRERDNSSFHLDQLPAATVATFEEPLITPSNVGTWKLLMEGKPIKTDIKHKDKERINRIPIWITTASPIDTNVDNNEKAQLQQRYKCFQFKNQIEHNITKNAYNPITKCPIFLQTKHIAALYVTNWPNILQYIERLDNQYTLSDDLLPTTTICTHPLNDQLQTLLTLPVKSPDHQQEQGEIQVELLEQTLP